MEQRANGNGKRDAASDGPGERAPFQVENERLELAAPNDDADGEDRDDRGRDREHHIVGDGAAPLGELHEQGGKGIADHAEQGPEDVRLHPSLSFG